MPWPLSPQLASVTDSPPRGEGWLHEMSPGGERVLVRLEGPRTRLASGSGQDWTERLASLIPSLARLSAGQAVLDGELVAGSMELHLFDLLALDGFDLRSVPLIRRKQLLAALIPESGPLRYVHHGIGRGREVLEATCAFGAPGIVSKRLDAPWSSGAGEDWLETRCQGREAFLIGGFLAGEDASLASLLLGERLDGELRYKGEVSTGFTGTTREQVQQTLILRARAHSPFSSPLPLRHPERVVWLEPDLSAEVTFAERTDQGELRFASFLGLTSGRADSPPAR